MTYGLSTPASVENGPSELVAKVDGQRSTARSWRVLNEACRLTMIERALSAANDLIDGFPAAL